MAFSTQSITGAAYLAPTGFTASANFTPAAAAYGAGDLIDVAKQFSFVDSDGVAVPAGALIRILTTVIRIDQTAVQAGETSYTGYLYSVTQPSAQADNALWTLASADLSAYLGSVALGTPADLGAACYVKTGSQDFDIKLTASSLYMRLVTVGAFTATAVARQISLFGIIL